MISLESTILASSFSRTQLMTDKTILGKVIRLPLKVLPETCILPILQTKMKGMKWIVGSGVHGYWLGTYERHKRVLFERMVQPGHVLFDIGAHVGWYSLLGSALVGEKGRVFSFEPFARNMAFLRLHLGINRVHNVTPMSVAISNADGMSLFQAGADSFTGQLSSGEGKAIRTATLDNLVFVGGLPMPDVLKIDAEGAEHDILCGASKILGQRHPSLLLATHSNELREKCLMLCQRYHYRVTSIGDLKDEFLLS